MEMPDDNPNPDEQPPQEELRLFGGSVSIKVGLNQLRLRLLDLTGRNRLINFKHTPGKSLQFIHSSLDGTFRRITGDIARKVSITPLPEPSRGDLERRNGRLFRPEPREHALQLGFDPSYELSRAASNTLAASTSGSQMRTLFYAEDLGKHCRKLEREAKLAIEETGANMLYLVMGFLEFPESPDGTRLYQAPLLCVPVTMTRSEEGNYSAFHLNYSGEELTDNLSLREKVKRDFGLNLPEYDSDNEDSVEAFLQHVAEAVATLPNWRVRRMLTLTLLSFTNMLLVRDLDPGNWPATEEESDLVRHPLVRQVFEGRPGDGDTRYGQEYSVDDHPKRDLPLIYDADSSQHSALIDVLAGLNRVIEGPPGTGKSQTITNLVAAALQSGKKILFVAEKLAALEVVKSRLTQAGLDPFVLELHSNKTNKKRVLEDIEARIKVRLRNLGDLPSLLEQQERKRKALKAYSELVNSKVGDHKELTLYQVMWRAEINRMRCGDCAPAVQDQQYSAATRTNAGNLAGLCDRLRYLASQYEPIGTYGENHPLWGFFPAEFKPEDDLPVQRTLLQYAKKFDLFSKATADATALLGGTNLSMSAKSADSLLSALAKLTPANPDDVDFTLLPAFFPDSDRQGKHSLGVLEDIKNRQEHLMAVEAQLSRDLIARTSTTEEASASAAALRGDLRALGLSSANRDELEETRLTIQQELEIATGALNRLAEIAEGCGLPFGGTVGDVTKLASLVKPLGEAPVPLLHLRHEALAVPGAAQRLRLADAHLRKLTVDQSVFNEHFYLDMAPAESELKEAILTLREGSAWYRIFQKRWRAAVGTHRRLERTKSKKHPNERLQELESWLSHQERQRAWRNDPALKIVAGPHYMDEQTPLADLERVAGWLEHALAALDVAQVPRQVFDPVSTDRPSVIRLVSYVPVVENAVTSLARLDTTARDAFRGATPRLLKRLDGELWSNRLQSVEQFVRTLHATELLTTGIVRPDVQADAGLSSMVASCELPKQIEALEGLEAGRNILGIRFKGRQTVLETALAAHKYGSLIVDASLPSRIERALLSPGCARNFELLNLYIRGISQGWQDAQDFETEMSRYGRFDSATWATKDARPTSVYAHALAERTRYAGDHLDALMPWAQYVGARKDAVFVGLEPFVAAMERGVVPPDKLKDAFMYRFYASIAQHEFGNSSTLRQFSGRRHSMVRAEYAELDRQIINLRGLQVAHECRKASAPPAGSNGTLVRDKTEMSLLNYLIPQPRPRVTVRAMLKRAGRAIQELKPCFMMGPQAVAQFLEPGQMRFDIVVMDEASQLRPEEAIGAIARGGQLVVVGDPKQLPPTSFFSRITQPDGDDDGMGQIATSEAESILDVCISHFQPVRTLRWHYRSRHESLIAFSNHNFYRGQLVVFPSPYPKSKLLGLRYTYVADGIYESQMNQIEAQRVVDAAIEHVLHRPHDSLGIVTLNIKQRDLVAEMLDERLRSLAEATVFKEKWEAQGMGLFVKNLENVQGDERDCIIISTTFGKPPGAEVVRQNFGPISRQGGWRRLNVLFTRARKSVAIFSSMRPADIVDDSRTPEGTRALRAYLEYAHTGVLPVERETGLPPDSDFEVAVMDVLRAKGFESTPQLGVAGFRIDIGVKHPEHRSGYLAAIECDGATYHTGVSVRDRDRIRQEILESLGWKGRIWRIWSTDWFRNPLAETERMLQFLETLKSQPVPEEYLFPSIPETEPLATDEPDIVGLVAAPMLMARDLVFEDEDGDLEIMVGDLVDYSPVESPDDERTVRITARRTDLASGMVAENTPLGSILMGATVGETVVLRVPGRDLQSFVVRSIRRDSDEVAH